MITLKERNQAIQDIFDNECMPILNAKGADYMDKDAFDQFTEIAEIVGVTPTQAMFVYMHKHVKALQSAMKNKALQGEALEKKLKDIINYAAMMIVYERSTQHEHCQDK